MNVMIIGSGWAGASAHHLLKTMNINSEIFETKNVVGGHSRSEKINDVICVTNPIGYPCENDESEINFNETISF